MLVGISEVFCTLSSNVNSKVKNEYFVDNKIANKIQAALVIRGFANRIFDYSWLLISDQNLVSRLLPGLFADFKVSCLKNAWKNVSLVIRGFVIRGII